MRLLLYTSLNKLRFHFLHKSRLSAIYRKSLSHRVIRIWITQIKTKIKNKKKENHDYQPYIEGY